MLLSTDELCRFIPGGRGHGDKPLSPPGTPIQEQRAALTLPAAAADLAEEGALAEVQQALLSDQLQQLRLQPLAQLPGVRTREEEHGSFTRRSLTTSATSQHLSLQPPALPTAHSQYRHSQRLLLVQSLCLPQLQDLAVVQCIHSGLEQLQGGGLEGQGPGDLLPHYLQHLQSPGCHPQSGDAPQRP